MAGASAPESWYVEPTSEEEEKALFINYFHTFTQRYNGDRDRDWLHEQAVVEKFGTRTFTRNHRLLEFFVAFSELIYDMDVEHLPRNTIFENIENLIIEIYDIFSCFSLTPVFEEALSDMHIQLQNRQTILRATISQNTDDSDSESISSSSSNEQEM